MTMSSQSTSPPSPPRKLLPQPIESTVRTNREASQLAASDTRGTKPRRQLPQPIETTQTQTHKNSKISISHKPIQEDPSHSKKSGAPHDLPPHNHITSILPSSTQTFPQPMADQSSSPKPRRFAPQVIETSRRRRKSTDTIPRVTPQDETDTSQDEGDDTPRHARHPRPSAIPSPPNASSNKHIVSSDQTPPPPDSKFSSAKLAEKKERQHSFRVPELAPIASSQSGTESNASSIPSLSASPSAESDETQLAIRRKKKRKSRARRESQDAGISGYFLSLAARQAEKQLRDQAMAAYPNEHAHEPVDHYAFDQDSDDDTDVEAGVGKLSVDGPAEHKEAADRVSARHRDSGAGLDMDEMRKHYDKLEREKEDQFAAAAAIGAPPGGGIGRRKSTRRALQEAQGNDMDATHVASRNIVGWQKDDEIKSMQKAASPPMAGGSLVFPKCNSPQATRLDVSQYPNAKNHINMETRQHTGLWTPAAGTSRRESGSGLWNGVCNIAHQEHHQQHKLIQTGLLTPSPERGDPFSNPSLPNSPRDSSSNSKSSNTTILQLPSSPPSSQSNEATNHLDSILHVSQALEEELNDAFTTQVYNYLSLGYPTLARKFDPELSKITRVPVEDLRKHDGKCNAKGYVGAPEGIGPTDVRGVTGQGEGKCERWIALRLYVREWGRQQIAAGGSKTFGNAVEELDGGWGARARKGSWAI